MSSGARPLRTEEELQLLRCPEGFRDHTWTRANLHEWLKNPKAKVPGTKMVFRRYPDDKKIDDVIAYLATKMQ